MLGPTLVHVIANPVSDDREIESVAVDMDGTKLLQDAAGAAGAGGDGAGGDTLPPLTVTAITTKAPETGAVDAAGGASEGASEGEGEGEGEDASGGEVALASGSGVGPDGKIIKNRPGVKDLL